MPTANNQQEPIGAEKKYQDASHTFSEALRRILRAADETESGDLTSLSQTKLSEESGVGRSTLAKYLAASKEQLANPTLEVLCKIAHALGVPPAFLLMTSDDWTRLAHAIHYYSSISTNGRFQKFAEQVTHPKSQYNHQEIAESGLEIAAMMGLIESPGSVDTATQKASVAATCLAPPITSLDTKFRPLLFTLCAIIGASTPR